MLTRRFLHDSKMIQMLGVVVSHLEGMGVICEIVSPTRISFSSTLPRSRVQKILESSSASLIPIFENVSQGARGEAEVQGIPRADE